MPGDVAVMDNPGSHKRKAVRAAIRATGAHLVFLANAFAPGECANYLDNSGYAST